MNQRHAGSQTALVCRMVLLIGSLALPFTARAAEVDDKATVEKLVNDLGSPDAQVRGAADNTLYMLFPSAFDAMEAASKREDLNPEASMRLKKAVTRIRPWVVARRRINAEGRATTEYQRRTSLEAYESVGKKDPKWDQAVRDGISRFFGSRTTQYTARRRFDYAIEKGCDDPMIIYLDVQLTPRTTPAEREKVEKLFRKAAESMEESQYPADRKSFTMLRYFAFKLDYEQHRPQTPGDEHRADASQVLDRMIFGAEKLWPAVCARPGIPKRILLDLGTELVQGFNTKNADLGNVMKNINIPLLKVLPNDSMPLLLKGKAYITWAWQARGSGLANTVTPEGWKLLHERLEVARDALTRSWELDHDNAEAATQMMTVMLGEGGDRDALELWFQRAMAADPDHYAACTSKLTFLEPKWYGNPDEMLAFGHECLDGRNWCGNIPFILIGVHRTLSEYASNQDDYFKNEQVWSDIESVYTPFLAMSPENNVARSRFANYACRSGKWVEARHEFQVLGRTAVPAEFGGSEAMERLKQLAEVNGGTPAP